MAKLTDIISDINKDMDENEKNAERMDVLDIADIDFNPDNVFSLTDTEEEIEKLAEALKDDGLMHNVVVVPNGEKRYMLLSGERRVKAYKHLGRAQINALILPKGTWLDNFKKLCGANTETRKYTNERCDIIIREIKEKLEENCPNQKNRSLLLSMVENAFNIEQAQAYKYINVSEDLIAPLKTLYFADVFGIDEAVLYSGLTQEAQDRIYEIYGEYDNAKELAQTYAKKVKTIITNCKKGLKGLKLKSDYASDRLEDAKTEGKEEDIRKYEESLAAIEKLMQELLDKRDEDIKNIEITEPTVQPKKAPAEVKRDYVNKIGKDLDSFVKQFGSSEAVEQIRAILATLLA